MRIIEHEASDLVVHATAPIGELGGVVLWLGGTPHTGALLGPVVTAAASIGRNVVSVARPGYGGTLRRAGRSVANAIDDVVRTIDLLRLDDAIVVGFSGGGPHAIAVGAATPDTTTAVLTLGCIAPYDETESWFVGMADPSALAAATRGRAARTAHPDDFDPSSFVPADYVALEGPWRDLALDAQAAHRFGTGGAIDDDMAFVRPWGFSLGACAVPVHVLHGEEDRVIPVSHGHSIAERLPDATITTYPHEGHISLLQFLDAGLRKIAAEH